MLYSFSRPVMTWLLGVIVALPLVAAEPAGPVVDADGVERTVLLPPGPGNPRNSEGDFVTLADGRVLLIYTRFTGGGGDHATADLVARESRDAGRTWNAVDRVIVRNEGQMNVMSVSLLRLAGGPIALFYLRKNSTADCRPCLRLSRDEGQTWSDPTLCVPDQVGYFVMNNGRAIQTRGGRLVLPLCLHMLPDYAKPDWQGTALCYLSDDEGRTWRASREKFTGKDPAGKRVTLQEPGLIELRDGRLMMYCRTTSGSQYVSYSSDHGDTWTPPVASNILSPCSPALVKRIPQTGDLLLVWNNHQDIDPKLAKLRTPFTVALSKDDGRTWLPAKTLENDPTGWYCYPAMTFVGDHVLIAHCSGSTKQYPHLSMTQVTRFPLKWLSAGVGD